jgi:hypothetical protein
VLRISSGQCSDGLWRQTRRSVDIEFDRHWNRANESKDRARAGAEYRRQQRTKRGAPTR